MLAHVRQFKGRIEQSRIPRIYSSSVVPWGLVLLLAASTLLLVVKHRSLEEEFQLHRRADLRVQTGAYLPAFSALSTTGETRHVAGGSQGGDRQFLILLTAECPYCARMLPVWKALYSELMVSDSTNTPFLALTTDSMDVARAYAEANKLPFPLIPFDGPKYVGLFRATLVPQIVVVDADGLVLFARSGVLGTKASVDSVRAAIHAGGISESGAPHQSRVVARQ